jgi:GNAT superfamily N-acetyltransferase
VGKYPFALRRAQPWHFDKVSGLVREAAEWLRAGKTTDQWASPWPDQAGHTERILNDLLKSKTWLVWDDAVAVATITVDTDDPVTLGEQPLWPADRRVEPALYVRRIIVSRRYAGRGLGAALLDWAADVAVRQYGVTLIRIDVWTTNLALHAYYRKQGFEPCTGRDPKELGDYPSQALFERKAELGTAYARLFKEEDPHSSDDKYP